MDWPPKITIVTPSFNQAKYLEETIMSVLGQGYPNLEYLIMDGGSTDGSVDVIKRYESKLAFWQSCKDKGQTDAINQGLRRATGELCAYLNSDDKLIEGSLWKMAFLSKQFPDCTVFLGANHQHFEDGGVIFRCPHPYAPGTGVGYPQDAAFWRRSVHDRIGFFDESFNFTMCAEFFMRTLVHEPCLFHSEPMSIMRIHPESKSATLSEVCVKERKRLKAMYESLKIPLGWRIRASLVGGLAALTGYLGRYLFKMIWRIRIPPICTK
jgi:glycosyltransferase involved in cell wall biosynthesis